MSTGGFSLGCVESGCCEEIPIIPLLSGVKRGKGTGTARLFFITQQPLCCPAEDREPVGKGSEKRLIIIKEVGKVMCLRRPILFLRDIVSCQSVVSQREKNQRGF